MARCLDRRYTGIKVSRGPVCVACVFVRQRVCATLIATSLQYRACGLCDFSVNHPPPSRLAHEVKAATGVQGEARRQTAKNLPTSGTVWIPPLPSTFETPATQPSTAPTRTENPQRVSSLPHPARTQSPILSPLTHPAGVGVVRRMTGPAATLLVLLAAAHGPRLSAGAGLRALALLVLVPRL